MIKVIVFALGLIILNKLVGIHTYSDAIEDEINKELTIVK